MIFWSKDSRTASFSPLALSLNRDLRKLKPASKKISGFSNSAQISLKQSYLLDCISVKYSEKDRKTPFKKAKMSVSVSKSKDQHLGFEVRVKVMKKKGDYVGNACGIMWD